MKLDITGVLPLLPKQALSIYLHTCTTVMCLGNIFLWELIIQQHLCQAWLVTPKNVTEQLLGLVRHSPLKYLTVLTLSSSVASSSHTNTVLGCCWKADTVHMWLTPSSMALYRAKALWAPVIRIITCTPRERGAVRAWHRGSRRAHTHPAKLRMGTLLPPCPQPSLCAAALTAPALSEITAWWVTGMTTWAPLH